MHINIQKLNRLGGGRLIFLKTGLPKKSVSLEDP